ncbi:amidohydrolase family protein [Sphingosinicella terrae]|uniref:amidohydrolase family protein n=1 Tax=Sphingosinicella terrae TaxID=2172047 RepID=UPI000E0DE7BD|nr:amidohydrolase family protein [Sphingosinicella terrae]
MAMKGRLAALLLAFGAAPAAAESWAITGARAHTATSQGTIEDATILIRDGTIVSVASGGAVPAGTRSRSAGGRNVTPALAAAATQIGLSDLGSAPESDDRRIRSGPLGAAFIVADSVDPGSLTLALARADGVGHAFVFPGPPAQGVISGYGAWLSLADPAAPVAQEQAALVAVAGILATDLAGGSRGAVWTQLRIALEEARRLRAGGRFDGSAVERANHEALLPLLERRVPLAVMAQREADIRGAAAFAREQGLRLVILGGAEAWRAADLLAAQRVAVVLDPLDDLPTSLDTIGARPDNAARLAAAGVEIAFSVSAQGVWLSYNVGPGLRTGAGLAVANGLPHDRALRAITAAPARIWGIAGGIGELRPGAPADLVIWDGDPLEPASAPVSVILAGREISLVTRQTLLRDRYAPATPRTP